MNFKIVQIHRFLIFVLDGGYISRNSGGGVETVDETSLKNTIPLPVIESWTIGVASEYANDCVTVASQHFTSVWGRIHSYITPVMLPVHK